MARAMSSRRDAYWALRSSWGTPSMGASVDAGSPDSSQAGASPQDAKMALLSGGPLAARIRTALLAYVFGVLGAFLLAVPWSPLWDYATLAVAQYTVGP